MGSPIGSLFDAWGQIEQGRSARRRGERAAWAMEFQAQQAEEQAGTAIAISQRGAMEEERKASLMTSRALAVAAASGGGVSDPTIINLIARTRGEGAYRSGVVLYEGESRARQLRLQAQAYRVSGADAIATGREQEFGSRIGALGSLAGGSGSLFANFGGGGPGGGVRDGI